MKNTFYFIFGLLTAILILLFGIEYYGREIIQDYWIERLWYEDLKLCYDVSKMTIIIIYLLFIVCWTYKQGMDAAHEIKKELQNDKIINENE